MLGINLDTQSRNSRNMLDEGQYPLKIVAHQRKTSTTNSRSDYALVEFEIVGGPQAGGKYSEMYNLWNAEPKVCNSAKADVAKMADAIGGVTGLLQHWDQIANRPFCATIVHKKDKNGEPQARIGKWEPIGNYSQSGGAPQVPVAAYNAPDPSQYAQQANPQQHVPVQQYQQPAQSAPVNSLPNPASVGQPTGPDPWAQ